MPNVEACNIGEDWNPVYCHGNKTADLYCEAHLVESFCKESAILIQID